ncbi:UNVERIFIED_CONTAM: hypothetical protein FKN15_036418 [Acipenser sinensis]
MISPPPFPLCADARSLLEDSEELGDDDYQASKRELGKIHSSRTQSYILNTEDCLLVLGFDLMSLYSTRIRHSI